MSSPVELNLNVTLAPPPLSLDWESGGNNLADLKFEKLDICLGLKFGLHFLEGGGFFLFFKLLGCSSKAVEARGLCVLGAGDRWVSWC